MVYARQFKELLRKENNSSLKIRAYQGHYRAPGVPVTAFLFPYAPTAHRCVWSPAPVATVHRLPLPHYVDALQSFPGNIPARLVVGTRLCLLLVVLVTARL